MTRKEMPEYRAWKRMKARCCNPNTDKFAHYGGRGIRVCDEWLKSFEAFYAHIGAKPTPDHSIDRIDNDGHYEPGNVRWATREDNANNRPQAMKITFLGQTMGLNQWARHLDMHASTLCLRMKRMSFEEAVRPYLGR